VLKTLKIQDIFQLVDSGSTTYKRCTKIVLKTYEIDISLTGENDNFNAHRGRAATPWGI